MKVNVAGELVRRLRAERGWTQEHLATLADTTVKTIQRVEKTGFCSIETRSALAAAFQIELKQLDGEERIQQAKADGDNGLLFYHRLLGGNALVAIFQDTLWYRFSNEDPRNAEDAETMAGAIQAIHDWSDIWSDIEAGGRVEAAFNLGELIKQLESKGILVFGLRTHTKMTAPHVDKDAALSGSVCNVHLAYADSNRVTVLDPRQ